MSKLFDQKYKIEWILFSQTAPTIFQDAFQGEKAASIIFLCHKSYLTLLFRTFTRETAQNSAINYWNPTFTVFHVENIGIDRRIFGILQTEIWYTLYSITYCFYLITVNHWKKQHEIRYHTLELTIATSLNNAWFHKIIIHSYFSGITRRYSAKSSYIFLSLFFVINTLVLSKKSFWVDFDMSIMHCNAKILKFFKKVQLFRKFWGCRGILFGFKLHLRQPSWL